jgi:hypothetical protein
MTDRVLLGRGRKIVELPEETWRREIEAAPPRIAERLDFMSAEHHAVRDFVVRELPSRGALSVAAIGETLGLHEVRVEALLAELESQLFFLVRGDDGWVRWAFPVTADETPHRLDLGGGERVFAA